MCEYITTPLRPECWLYHTSTLTGSPRCSTKPYDRGTFGIDFAPISPRGTLSDPTNNAVRRTEKLCGSSLGVHLLRHRVHRGLVLRLRQLVLHWSSRYGAFHRPIRGRPGRCEGSVCHLHLSHLVIDLHWRLARCPPSSSNQRLFWAQVGLLRGGTLHPWRRHCPDCRPGEHGRHRPRPHPHRPRRGSIHRHLASIHWRGGSGCGSGTRVNDVPIPSILFPARGIGAQSGH
jgi:hypothetical protein